MFIGHFAVGFAAKRWAPRTPLALLLLAPLLADVLWPALILAGVERARIVPSLFAAGVALYAGATRARRLSGKISLWALLGLLAVAYAFQPWTPPPPSMTAVAVMALVMTAITLVWAVWIERTREPRQAAP